MPPQPRKARIGDDPRGNLPALTDDQMRELYQKASFLPRCEDLMQVFSITSDVVWVRRFIWPFIRKDSGWRPLYSVGKLVAGQRVLIYEMPRKPANDWYLADVERALYTSKDFTFFRNPEINYKLRQHCINLSVKKEIYSVRNSKNLQDPTTEHMVAYEIYGVDPEPDQVPDSNSRSPRKAKTARIFGHRKMTVRLWTGDVDSVWGSSLCGGRKDCIPADASLAALNKKVDAVVDGMRYHIGFFNNPVEADEWITIRDDDTLRYYLNSQQANDPSGGSCEVIVHEGDAPADNE